MAEGRRGGRSHHQSAHHVQEWSDRNRRGSAEAGGHARRSPPERGGYYERSRCDARGGAPICLLARNIVVKIPVVNDTENPASASCTVYRRKALLSIPRLSCRSTRLCPPPRPERLMSASLPVASPMRATTQPW